MLLVTTPYPIYIHKLSTCCLHSSSLSQSGEGRAWVCFFENNDLDLGHIFITCSIFQSFITHKGLGNPSGRIFFRLTTRIGLFSMQGAWCLWLVPLLSSQSKAHESLGSVALRPLLPGNSL